MEELLQLRTYIEQQQYKDALLLVGEMEEMSREDKLNKIHSFSIVLLIHLIKRETEKRTTRSWDVSIIHAVREVKRTNKRRKAGGFYAKDMELHDVLEDAYEIAIHRAALEAFEGMYSTKQLAQMVDKGKIIEQALHLIMHDLE
jgi:hypothetical protein